MTAIASVYVPAGFVIAADGRCRSDDDSKPSEFESDHAQKIFPIENEGRAFAYSLIGFAGTNDGKFKMVEEIRKVVEKLANRRFSDCGLYIHKFSHSLQLVITKARRDGIITEFPDNGHRPPELRNRIFRLLIVGYFKQIPWLFEVKFVLDEQNRIRFFVESSQPHDATAVITGSDIIANAMYVNKDPRFIPYAKPRSGEDTLTWATEYVRGYIEACGDPMASELDPGCKNIGGHTHIAEITPQGGFRWVVAPL
jgi:hypothetical protein